MGYRPVVVVEANEVPLRVVADGAEQGRLPYLGKLLESGSLIETEADEALPRELYPAQSWASLNTGVPWARHQISWYGDPKPACSPLYWQLVARSGRSAGLVNTLHSSPLATQCAEGRYSFVVPDCFAADDSTVPASLSGFQRANLSLTAANSRRVSTRPNPGDLIGLGRSVPQLGLRPRTAAELAGLMAGVGVGRIPRERVRLAQFLVQKDLFLRLVDRHRPDLAVLFTNHVAAAMHRYWYASYPDDFDHDHYPPEWVERYRDEIPTALTALDRFLVDLDRWCRAHGRTLVVASSMGQGPSDRLDARVEREAVVSEPGRFLQAIGVGVEVRVVGAMNPQITLDCGDAGVARSVADRLIAVDGREDRWRVDRAGHTVTLTYSLEVIDDETVVIGDTARPAKTVGVEIHAVDDHSSGRHTPRGILAVANSPSYEPPGGGLVGHLSYAPALLRHLGVDPPAHLVEPELVI